MDLISIYTNIELDWCKRTKYKLFFPPLSTQNTPHKLGKKKKMSYTTPSVRVPSPAVARHDNAVLLENGWNQWHGAYMLTR